MFESLECIALRTVRYNDERNLLSAWSRQRGRLTFSVGAGSTREARRRRSLTAPLALFEAECDLRPGRDIFPLRDVRPSAGSLALSPDPLKGLSAQFLAEFLDLVLRRAEPEQSLSDYLFGALRQFADLRGPAAADFHLKLIYGLTHYAGIEPDIFGADGLFDLREGCVRPVRPLHDDFLDRDLTESLRRVAAADLSASCGLSHTERNLLTDALLRYYSIHLLPLTSLKSLDILRALF